MASRSSARALVLLADLAEALGRAHTEATIVQSLAEVLARSLPLRWVELAVYEGAQAASDPWIHHPGATAPTRSGRSNTAGSLAGPPARGARTLRLAQATRAERATPELRRA